MGGVVRGWRNLCFLVVCLSFLVLHACFVCCCFLLGGGSHVSASFRVAWRSPTTDTHTQLLKRLDLMQGLKVLVSVYRPIGPTNSWSFIRCTNSKRVDHIMSKPVRTSGRILRRQTSSRDSIFFLAQSASGRKLVSGKDEEEPLYQCSRVVW